MFGRGLEDAAQIVHGGGAVDVEAELRELERHVALDARLHDGAEDAGVLARCGVGLLRAGDAFTEVVEREMQTAIA
jgi:hypothetical protein